MNTHLTASMIGEVSNNERVMRALTGIGLAPLILSAEAAPLALFIMSMASVYLCMTAIIGYDPFYAASDAIKKRLSQTGDYLLSNDPSGRAHYAG